MLINMQDPKYVTLLGVIENDGSMGAGKAQAALYEAGIVVSEPTAGRALRDLEREGLLAKNGSRGRALTPLGLKHLREYQQSRKSYELTAQLAKHLNPREKEELIDILVARRAVEVALVELAAPRITPEQIKQLRRAVKESGRLLKRHKSVSEMDTEFHTVIAEASGNNTLAAALKLIWHGGEYARKLEKIRYHSKEIMSDDHEKIISALERGNSDLAGRTMETHLNNILRDVEQVPEHVMEEGLTQPL